MTDALTQAAMVRRGECSPLELVDEAIARIEAVNPSINAVIHQRFEKARQEARHPTDGPFHGVPIVVKDSTCPIAGEPLHEGLQAAKDAGYRAPANSWLTDRLIGAGFVIVGRTIVPELCTHDDRTSRVRADSQSVGNRQKRRRFERRLGRRGSRRHSRDRPRHRRRRFRAHARGVLRIGGPEADARTYLERPR